MPTPTVLATEIVPPCAVMISRAIASPSTCGLTDTSITPYWWSKTQVTATDAARLGQCLSNGPGISPEWRDRLLAMMRDISPDGRFGIPEAPALRGKPLSVKNGWTLHGNTWTVTVLTRFQNRPGGYRYGAEACSTVAQQLFSDAPEH